MSLKSLPVFLILLITLESFQSEETIGEKLTNSGQKVTNSLHKLKPLIGEVTSHLKKLNPKNSWNKGKITQDTSFDVQHIKIFQNREVGEGVIYIGHPAAFLKRYQNELSFTKNQGVVQFERTFYALKKFEEYGLAKTINSRYSGWCPESTGVCIETLVAMFEEQEKSLKETLEKNKQKMTTEYESEADKAIKQRFAKAENCCGDVLTCLAYHKTIEE